MRNKFLPLMLLIIIIAFFFNSFIIRGKLPVPSDTIIGLYHPFRDLYAKNYPNGIPFKNFLITDPVRQQYPWRKLAIQIEKNYQLPTWNPYAISGTPLLANFQSAIFYPLNAILYLLPFSIGWSILIFLGPILAGIFTYLYLRNLNLDKRACFLGSLAFPFSGFFVSWMEWGTVTHVMLWLPLMLLSIDKIFSNSKFNPDSIGTKLQFKIKNYHWYFVFLGSLISSFLAGHLQIFFYLFLLSTSYFFVRWVQNGKNKNIIFLFLILYSFFLILTFIQWYPTLRFILESGREVDQMGWQREGWFIPWQNIVQFIVPDFFGNPTTLNYWGVWNYGEFVGYIGILPLLFALLALFFRHDKKTFFFGTVFFLSLIFSLPTFFAKLPFILNIPYFSSSQPTRLLFVTDFSLSILAALGFDYFVRNKKTIIYPMVFMLISFVLVWFLVLSGGQGLISMENLPVVKNNLYLPTMLFAFFCVALFVLIYFSKNRKISHVVYTLMLLAVVFDLMRFGLKFTPFTNKEYLFPQTKTLSFLQNKIGIFRIMSVDERIMPPNFSTVYKLQDVSGYDPLYLQRYAELIAASERGKPDITPPFGFNRIINPKRFDSKIIDLLGVKYILSLTDISDKKLTKVFQEGKTRVYENKGSLPRVFFVDEIFFRGNKNEVINLMFDENFNLRNKAVVEDVNPKNLNVFSKWGVGISEIVSYSENKVKIRTENSKDGFLVLTDTFYPTWHAKIDPTFRSGQADTKIFRTDYNFRGIIVPKGKHVIEFYNTLF